MKKAEYETTCPRIKRTDHFVLKELAKKDEVTMLVKFEEILQFYLDTKEENNGR